MFDNYQYNDLSMYGNLGSFIKKSVIKILCWICQLKLSDMYLLFDHFVIDCDLSYHASG